MSPDVRVLVVEDEETAAAAHTSYVERTAGFAVAGVARSAAEAVRRLGHSQGADRVDLMLLDMHLPDGHGLGLLQRIRAAGHLCDVIAVTSARDSEVVRAAVAQGVVLYLLKPFTYASFRTKLEQYLAYREQLVGGENPADQVDQDRLDQVLGALRPAAAPPAKGMSAETRQQVLAALRVLGDVVVGERGRRRDRHLPGDGPALPRAAHRAGRPDPCREVRRLGTPGAGVPAALTLVTEGGRDDLARLGLHLREVLGALERLGVDLVDVLGAGGPGGEPGRTRS